MALDVANSTYTVEVVEHIPGVANTAADILSRLADPNKKAIIPQYLDGVHRHTCTVRNRTWYKSLPASPK